MLAPLTGGTSGVSCSFGNLGMGAEENKGRLLSSWKEIADYLKCDVRTCRRWELTRGLPIHRLDGGQKSRIFAYQRELDDWVKGIGRLAAAREADGRETEDPDIASQVPSEARTRRKFLYLAVPIFAAGALLFLFSARPFARRLQPADFRIDGQELVILAKSGQEMWRFDTGLEGLRDDRAYHRRFQLKTYPGPQSGPDLPWIIIRDINGDGRPEVLFCTWTIDERGGGLLLCFSDRGRELWRFQGGREMRCGSRQYGRHYNTAGFDTLDTDGDGRLEVIVINHQTPNWLAQLAVLDPDGRLTGEYWNAGHLSDFTQADLDGDGAQEILVVGLNNEYGKGCLITFDPGRVSGGSPQSKPDYTCQGIGPGTETHYLLFPRTDVDLAANPVEAIGEVVVEGPNLLSLETTISGIYFILDFKLAVEDVNLSHGFMTMHRQALEAGKVHSDLNDPRYKETLMQGVLYFDGRGWTTTPTRVNRSSP